MPKFDNRYNLILDDLMIPAPDRLTEHLYQCLLHDCDCVIDTKWEAYDLYITGVYRIIDRFVDITNYDPARITIVTANVIDRPYRYKLIKQPKYWYELDFINKWLIHNTVDTGVTPVKHFGNFVGRATWYRIWIAAYLWNQHRACTLQTFHSGLAKNYTVPKDDGIFDVIGLEDLNRFDCDYWPEVVKFLHECPINVDQGDLDRIRSAKFFVPAANDDCYPIQHPANLNVLELYKDFFVDVVCESHASGDVFYCSEKTWRPIIARRPFLLMSNRESLRNLRRLGFRTFDQWWDESYDDYGERDRVKRINSLTDFIAGWPIHRLGQVLEEMQPVLEHNRQNFLAMDWKRLRNEFC
jgi:hypothetical protein